MVNSHRNLHILTMMYFSAKTGITTSRGPDMSQILETSSGWLCFHRLAIMGLTEAGMQPFELDGDYVVCNGEIYGRCV